MKAENEFLFIVGIKYVTFTKTFIYHPYVELDSAWTAGQLFQ